MKHAASSHFRELERLGFEMLWVNGHGDRVFVHPGDPAQTEVKLNPSAREQQIRQTLARARKLVGSREATNKRNTGNIKARADADRARLKAEIERTREERRKAIQMKDRMLAGWASRYTSEQIRQVEAFIEAHDRELRHLQTLMTALPNGVRSANTARHRSGQRDQAVIAR